MQRKAAAKPKPRDPAEYKRFLDTAKDVEADESPDVFDHAFKKVTADKRESPKPSGRRSRPSAKRASS